MTASGKKIVLGVTGSIAAVKAPELVRLFREKGYSVSCLMTKAAEQFASALALSVFCDEPVVTDVFGADGYKMHHLRLAEQAAVLVIAPASAGALSRLATGQADDNITLAYLATKAPVLIAPAMHDTMWEHPATQANVKILKDRGATFVGPIKGKLADQTSGDGRMADLSEIVKAAECLLPKNK